MNTRPIHWTIANAIVGVAVVGIALTGTVSCTSQPAGPPAPPPAPAAPAPATDQQAANQAAALGPAAQAAAGLAALGALGSEQGAGQQVRDLGGQLATEGQALQEQLQAMGAEASAAQLTPAQEATIADLQARTGEQFDPAWLRAAGEALQQARDAANAVLASPDASEEAKAAARNALARLDALIAAQQQAARSAGAGAPGEVAAGTGGQAEGDVGPVAAVLFGAGLALLGGALLWRRRA
jgi:hypothetical protein